MLEGFGLKPSEIASILGKKSSYISKELSLARSKKIAMEDKLEIISKKISILIALTVRSLPDTLDTRNSIKLLDSYGLSSSLRYLLIEDFYCIIRCCDEVVMIIEPEGLAHAEILEHPVHWHPDSSLGRLYDKLKPGDSLPGQQHARHGVHRIHGT